MSVPDKEKPEKLHGNHARINPKKHVDGTFITNMAALSSAGYVQNEDEMEDAVEYAKTFVDENKK